MLFVKMSTIQIISFDTLSATIENIILFNLFYLNVFC